MIFVKRRVKILKGTNERGRTVKKNQIIVLVSVIVGVAAAVAAVILVLKHLEKKKAEIAPANLAFETDFTEEEAE